MSWMEFFKLDRLERRFGRYAMHHMTIFLLMGQALVYMLVSVREDFAGALGLIPALVFRGEIWRLVTFAFVPPILNPVWMFFAWYLFFLMGTALEQYWGSFRYNLFLLVGYIVTVLVSFLMPLAPASNAFIGTSVFLAFAYLYPDFVMYIFFIIPVKIRWLAALTWLIYILNIFMGGLQERLLVLASIANLAAFFGKDAINRVRMAQRRIAVESKAEARSREAFHTCATCGATDLSMPDLDFRYCTTCEPVQCYCQIHLHTHEHVAPSASSSQ